MRKRILALLLSFVLLLSLSPAARAAEGEDTRKTDFFTDQPHTELDYTDIPYEHIDPQPILDEMDELRGLFADASNAKAVEERFCAIMDQIDEQTTAYCLSSLRHDLNVLDEDAASELEYATGVAYKLEDAINLLIRDGLRSPCKSVFQDMMTEEAAASYLEYEAMTEEQLAMNEQEAALLNEYYQTALLLTVEYDGEEWTEDSAYNALLEGEISPEAYSEISEAYLREENRVLGEIYLRMVALRKQIAENCGYDNYVDYAYAEIYQRDYTQEEIRTFHQAVKDNHFPQLVYSMHDLFLSELDMDVYFAAHTGEDILELLEPYMEKMSSELAESYRYMRTHHFYDVSASDIKASGAYTMPLPSYGVPFFYLAPSTYLEDQRATIHEFGHYNHAYWHGLSWADNSESHDLSEVHSQGMELMFRHWYDEILGENAQMFLDYQLFALIGAIVDGALYDELQQYVYATDNVTLEQINRKYRQLSGEYGIVAEDDPQEEMYDWVEVPHTFAQPCYYISYAVSAAGAFAFWMDAQEGDYFQALDKYLQFTALPTELTFQESFAALEMENPLSPEYLTELAQAIRKATDMDARVAALEEAGPSESEWYSEAVSALIAADVVAEEDFRPDDPATWSEAARLINILTKDESLPVEDGDAPITRGEFAALMADVVGETPEAPSPFSDTDDDGVALLAELGVVSGYPDGNFYPDQPVSYAEMYVMFYRLMMSAVDRLMSGLAA